MPQRAPLRIAGEQIPIPDGDFLLPVCTNKERALLMLQALVYGGLLLGYKDKTDHMIDVLNALAHVEPGCPEQEIPCRTYPASSGVFQWAPHNPFTEPDWTGPGYGATPWLVDTGNQTLIGVEKGDVYSDVLRAPGTFTNPLQIPTSFEALLQLGLPRFRIGPFVGTGYAEVTFISVPVGGRMVVIVDGNLLFANVIDTDLDLLSVPFETNPGTILRCDFPSPGTHYVDVFLWPLINTTAPFFRWGGGVRSVQVCGLDVPPGADLCCPDAIQLITEITNIVNAK